MGELDQIRRLHAAVNGEHCVCPHAEVMDSLLDRQERLAEAHGNFANRIDAHTKEEDVYKQGINDRFTAIDDRMKNTETNINALNRLVDAFEGFQKSLKIAGYFAACVVAVMLWIFSEKNADIKATQATLISHSITLEQLVRDRDVKENNKK